MKWNIVVGSMVLGASLSGQSFGGDLLSRLLGGKGCGASSSCCDTSVTDPSCGAEMAPCGNGPSCGAEIAAPCGSGCNAGPSCGAEIAAPCGPSCGVEACAPASNACCNVRTPILDALKGMKGKLKCKLASLHAKKAAPSCGAEVASCDPCGAAPSCGAEIAAAPCGPSCGAEIAACDPCGAAPSCDSGCGLKKHLGGGLLSKIFNHKKGGCDSGCAAPCGATACDAAPAGCSSCGSTPVSAPAAAPAAAPAPVVDPHAYLNTKRHVIQASSTRVR